MPVLDKLRYNAAYFGDLDESNGMWDSYGYKNYLEKYQLNRFNEGQENNLYSSFSHELLTKIQDVNFLNLSVLDIGGAIGGHSLYGKNKLGIGRWDVLDLNIDTWCERHKVATVDNFITGDALVVLPTMGVNAYDVIFSCQFLDCVSDAELPALITQMNRVGRRQIHIITTEIDPQWRDGYNVKTLETWKTLGFRKGTILIDYGTKQVLVV